MCSSSLPRPAEQSFQYVKQLTGSLAELETAQVEAFASTATSISRLHNDTVSSFDTVFRSQEAVDEQLLAARAKLQELFEMGSKLAAAQQRLVDQAHHLEKELANARDHLVSLVSEASYNVQQLRVEFFAATAYLFYPALLLTLFVATSVRRTADAKAWLLLQLIACCALEQLYTRNLVRWGFVPEQAFVVVRVLRLCFVGTSTYGRCWLAAPDPQRLPLL